MTGGGGSCCGLLQDVSFNGSLLSSGCPAVLQPPSEGTSLRLVPSPALSPEEFERVWLQLQPVGPEQLIRIPALPLGSPQTLQAALQLVSIQVLAFTPPHTLPWRVYLYTHTQRARSASSLILGELLWPGGSVGPGEGEEDLRVTLKQQPPDDEALRGFVSVLTAVLQTVSSQGD